MRGRAYNCEFIKDCYDIFVWPLVNNGVWGWGWYLDPAIVIFCSVSDCYCENRAQVATPRSGWRSQNARYVERNSNYNQQMSTIITSSWI